MKIPEDQGTFVLGTVILVAIGGVVLWSWLVKKFGTLSIWRLALITLAISFVPLYFANNLIFAICACVIVGLGFSGVISTMDIIGAKIMDEDYLRYGVKREGIFSSAMGFMNRLSGFFISLAALLAARIYGFESGEVPGDNPDKAARFMLTIFPFCLVVLGIVVSFFVKFTFERQASFAC